MPAIYAHYAFGCETIPQFSAPVQRIVLTHRPFFDLGLQGPDFYFFDQRLMLMGRRYARIGSVLHEDACAALLLRLEGKGAKRLESAQLAYIFGLIGHFALDQAAHPHIAHWVEELAYNHHRLETEFDRHLLARAGVHARTFPLGTVISATRRQRIKVGQLYEAAGLGSAADIAALLHDFCFIKNHTSFRHNASYQLLQTVLTPFGAQKSIGGIFMGPEDEKSRETNPLLLVLFEEAQEAYAALAENYWQHTMNNTAFDAYFWRNFETTPEENA